MLIEPDPPRLRKAAAWAAFAVLFVGACGTRDVHDRRAATSQVKMTASSQADAAPNDHSQAAIAVDWQNPLVAGVIIATADRASLAFNPLLPSSALGTATRILATESSHARLAERQIAWLFNEPPYGSFVVIEHVASQAGTLREFQDLVNIPRGCITLTEAPPVGRVIQCSDSAHAIVSIRGGIQALLQEGETVTAVRWTQELIEPNWIAIREIGTMPDPILEVILMAPAESMSGPELLDLANSV